MKHEAWGRWAQRLGITISPVEGASLDAYEELLVERALPLGMIGAGERDGLRERHVVDCLRAAPLLGSPQREVADLGSGAGLPGIPLAIVRPDLRFLLLDVRRRRVAFLELVVDTLALNNVRVHQGPVERIARRFDVCLARALADPVRSWHFAEPLLARGGTLLYWAGRGFDAASEPPEGARFSVSASATLADAGPVVIMTRQ